MNIKYINMRKFFLLIAMMMVTTTIMAKEKLDIKSITDGTFAAKRMSGMIPIEGTDQYARIENEGTTIKTYSFKTGKETGTLFDANHTQGETVKSIDGYIMSPDGKKMLIQTNTKSIYRRSYTFATGGAFVYCRLLHLYDTKQEIGKAIGWRTTTSTYLVA